MAVLSRDLKTVSVLITVFFCVSCRGDGLDLAQKNTSVVQKDAEQTDTLSENEEVSIVKLEGQKESRSLLEDFDQSPFSKFIYFHKNKNKLLIDYNFFPEGSDFDSQKKEVRIPCQFLLKEKEGASVGLNAPISGGSCRKNFSLDIKAAKFTLAGLEFAFDESFDLFEDDFGMILTPDGFFDTQSGAALEEPFSEATLENFVLSPETED